MNSVFSISVSKYFFIKQNKFVGINFYSTFLTYCSNYRSKFAGINCSCMYNTQDEKLYNPPPTSGMHQSFCPFPKTMRTNCVARQCNHSYLKWKNEKQKMKKMEAKNEMKTNEKQKKSKNVRKTNHE